MWNGAHILEKEKLEQCLTNPENLLLSGRDGAAKGTCFPFSRLLAWCTGFRVGFCFEPFVSAPTLQCMPSSNKIDTRGALLMSSMSCCSQVDGRTDVLCVVCTIGPEYCACTHKGRLYQ